MKAALTPIMEDARRKAEANPRPELARWAAQMPPGVLDTNASPLLRKVRDIHAMRQRFDFGR